MAFVELPAPAPVDESRRGILTIADAALLSVLGVPGNHRVEEIRVTTTGNLQIEIVGEDMPNEWVPKAVVLLCTVERNELTGERRVFGSWEHKPEKRWRLR